MEMKGLNQVIVLQVRFQILITVTVFLPYSFRHNTLATLNLTKILCLTYCDKLNVTKML